MTLSVMCRGKVSQRLIRNPEDAVDPCSLAQDFWKSARRLPPPWPRAPALPRPCLQHAHLVSRRLRCRADASASTISGQQWCNLQGANSIPTLTFRSNILVVEYIFLFKVSSVLPAALWWRCQEAQALRPVLTVSQQPQHRPQS
jgi:hypothetical protein